MMLPRLDGTFSGVSTVLMCRHALKVYVVLGEGLF
jgi:hypothetical protein